MSTQVTQVNLLPQEIAESRRLRQKTILLFVIGVLVGVGLVALFFFRNIELNSQRERLATAQAQVKVLQTKVDLLEEFAKLEETVKQKQATLTVAMANDVAWSRLLVELSMIIPGDSWITSFSGATAAAAAPTGPPATGPPAAPGAQAATLGSVNFSAVTFDFPGVAKWITRLQELNSLSTIWVPSAAKGEIGERDVVNYTSTASLTDKAGSGRYQGSGK